MRGKCALNFFNVVCGLPISGNSSPLVARGRGNIRQQIGPTVARCVEFCSLSEKYSTHPPRASVDSATWASGDGFRVVAPGKGCPDLRLRTPGGQPIAEVPEETLESGGDDEQERTSTGGWNETVAGGPGHEHE